MELTESEKAQLKDLLSRIDLASPTAVIDYGAYIQKKISEFADTLDKTMKIKNVGYAVEALSGLTQKLKDMDGNGPSCGGFFQSIISDAGLPAEGPERVYTAFRKVNLAITSIIDGLEQTRIQLGWDSAMLDELYKEHLRNLRGLEIYILAGEMKLKEVNEKILPDLMADAEACSDGIEAQAYRDRVQQQAGLFDKNLYDLRLSREVALQTGIELKLIRNNNRLLAEKILKSVLNIITLWKKQIIVAAGLFVRIEQLELGDQIPEATRKLLDEKKVKLQEKAGGIAQKAAKGRVDIESVRVVNADLVSMIDDTIKHAREWKTRKKEAERELEKIEKDIQNTLAEIKHCISQ